jgi:hypothetical protein
MVINGDAMLTLFEGWILLKSLKTLIASPCKLGVLVHLHSPLALTLFEVRIRVKGTQLFCVMRTPI